MNNTRKTNYQYEHADFMVKNLTISTASFLEKNSLTIRKYEKTWIMLTT